MRYPAAHELHGNLAVWLGLGCLAVACVGGELPAAKAQGGQSSKSFRDSGNWQKTLDAKPAYILIQYCPRKAAR